jgi:hypothetical protein
MIFCGAHFSTEPAPLRKFLQLVATESGHSCEDAFTITEHSRDYFFSVTPGPAIDLLVPTPARTSDARKFRSSLQADLAPLWGRIHNHGAAPHDYFLSDDAAWLRNLLRCPLKRNSAARILAVVAAESSAPLLRGTHSQSTKQLHMIFFLNAAWRQ